MHSSGGIEILLQKRRSVPPPPKGHLLDSWAKNFFWLYEVSNPLFHNILFTYVPLMLGYNFLTKILSYTGWFIMIEKKIELHTRARIQAASWERCTFSNDILTFWNCASKYSKELNVFFKFGRYFDYQILKMCKIQWKWRIKQKSVVFCKYFCKKAPIFMKGPVSGFVWGIPLPTLDSKI